MKELYSKVSIGELCGLFGYTRQNFYKTSKISTKRNQFEELIITEVKAIRMDQPRIGTSKLQYLLNQKLGSEYIGRDKLHGILGDKNMLIRRRKKFRPKMTNGNGESLYPDLRKELKVQRINQLWCSDITYIELRTRQKHCYLVCVTDEYSHLIVGYHLGLRMRTWQVLQAMQMAVDSQLEEGNESFSKPLIIHSDRGSQYKSLDFKIRTKKWNMLCSMTRAGKSYENPVAERLNGILKNELLVQDFFNSFEEAQKAIERAIKIYNEERPHLSCNMLTPKQAHLESDLLKVPLKKLWRQRKRKAKKKKKNL